ncbi:MAG: HupE/UreJ family protein [Acidobacteria bacterium]|nr:HupE/UreJ family protein [Acidobacteriota bacterium]
MLKKLHAKPLGQLILLLPVLLLLSLAAGSLAAHSMSMSNGELSLEGDEAVLSIRVPDYEVQQLADPQQALLGAFILRVEGRQLERTAGQCSANEADGSYDCTSRFGWPEKAAVVEVECDLADAVAPNHVHVLRAVSSDGAEQQVFDYASRKQLFRFRPMGVVERIASEAKAGAVRILLGPAQMLFLFALVVAARGRRELVQMAAAFLTTLAATAIAVSIFGWQPPPGFADAAGALTIAYLAVETLTLPEAGGRWLVAGGMGAFHGLYFGVFLQQASMSPAAVLAGAFAAGVLVLALLFAVVARLSTDFGESLLRKVCAGALCLIGVGWFLSGLT